MSESWGDSVRERQQRHEDWLKNQKGSSGGTCGPLPNAMQGAGQIPPADHTAGYAQEVRVTDSLTGGAKGQKLCEMGAMDPASIMEVGNVAGFGAQKYDRYNFAKGYKWSLSYDAMQRHLMAFWNGQDRDDESGLYHLAHAAWHCLTLLTFVMRKRGTDDRFPQRTPQQQEVEKMLRDKEIQSIREYTSAGHRQPLPVPCCGEYLGCKTESCLPRKRAFALVNDMIKEMGVR